VPVLTRYKKEAGIKAFVKKELFDTRVPEPDELRPSQISVLATPTLCVQLNTLYVSSTKLDYTCIIFTLVSVAVRIFFFSFFIQATFLMRFCSILVKLAILF